MINFLIRYLGQDNFLPPRPRQLGSTISHLTADLIGSQMSSLKRFHSQFVQSDGNNIDSDGPSVKRACPPIENDVLSGHSKPESINQVYMDCLSDISDEIRFAVKCIDRAAGDETSLATIIFFVC